KTLMKDAFEDAVDTAKAVAVVMSDKVEEAVTEVKEMVEEVVTELSDKKPDSEIMETDDLKAIEGIGPKIEEILNEAGIKTYAQLAAASPEQLKTFLTTAGSRYNNHDPGTWPRQAEMAKNGQWDELKAWQDELDGGKEVKASGEEE
ncbi:MAG: helix-hairpin-helix domain-containing protein, partial [Bacteroidota bacterium]